MAVQETEPATAARADAGPAGPGGPQRGLTSEEAASRLGHYGKNVLEEKRASPLVKLLSHFWGPIPWMIEVAAMLSVFVGRWVEFAIIVVLLLINAGVAFWQEFKADNAIALLKQKLALRARVLRNGRWQDIAASDLVPGDIIFVRLGNIIPADARLLDGDYLSVDQSALTGESLPVDKKPGDVAYSGSIAKMGEMTAQVTATGMNTYFGKTAKLVQETPRRSHFQRAVLRIGNFLILVTVALVAMVLVVALYRHTPLVDSLQFALILTVAAIPVALPAVLSVTMAVGAERLARMKAIVSRLVSIEELAGIDVLLSDKTGTLTQNRLTTGKPVLFEAADDEDLLLAAALASRREEADAIDAAILAAFGQPERLAGFTVAHFRPFDPVSKRTEADIGTAEGGFKVAKGAPQVILDLVRPDPALVRGAREAVDAFAAKGYRTLAVARRDSGAEWKFLGLLPLFDPPREDAARMIADARAMGVSVKMVTGDHRAIARQVAIQLKLGRNIVTPEEVLGRTGTGRDTVRFQEADGFAQVFPEHKFEIVKTYQDEGRIVGMTGDGVNDAPALRLADAGIAVSGATDAARAAGSLVLTASGLSVIIKAVREARRIFERMNSYAIFRIAETIRVLVFITLSILVFNFYPVTAVMIVLLALLNDFPIMTIAYDNAPTPERPVRWDMQRVLTIATVLGLTGVVSSFVLFWIAQTYLSLPTEQIQTLIFLKLLVAGHLTIFLTRNTGTIWQRPLPSWPLFITIEATQVIGTLAAVYGWFITPIGWSYALIVWGYALIWFLLNSLVKLQVYRLLGHRVGRQDRHLRRVEKRLHPLG